MFALVVSLDVAEIIVGDIVKPLAKQIANINVIKDVKKAIKCNNSRKNDIFIASKHYSVINIRIEHILLLYTYIHLCFFINT